MTEGTHAHTRAHILRAITSNGIYAIKNSALVDLTLKIVIKKMI